jgi:DNA-binding response OmpR family regulator
VVDDEEALRGMICAVLRQGGYSVLEAGDGETASQIHGRHRGQIDLLLTDIGLPGQNGCELAAELRRSEPVLEVLFMSGRPSSDIDECGESWTERHRFLQKPFGLRELLETVEHFLDSSPSSRESAPA